MYYRRIGIITYNDTYRLLSLSTLRVFIIRRLFFFSKIFLLSTNIYIYIYKRLTRYNTYVFIIKFSFFFFRYYTGIYVLLTE